MATPFKGVAGGSKDVYNCYQSQICIHVECSFGMLVHHWDVLIKAMPSAYGFCVIFTIIALMHKMAILHNHIVWFLQQRRTWLTYMSMVAFHWIKETTIHQTSFSMVVSILTMHPPIIADVGLRQERQGKTVCCPGTFSMKLS
jgi:hypothetical protein